MYGRLWRVLPGGALLKTAILAVTAALIALGLWYCVFPVVDQWLPFSDSTVTP
ncbi:hypothetical protein OG439_07975 [Amycolatopsis sp. NBC_01307]|uniref:hypothetical protein n=1 Tax=Amycolatopsis sp. NBC_01307 TaxID=2903561 RepID=UPI002E0F0241|nr:hypothetical protein OG439_07975 [Amycolatopsis sp. NBC_01307]